jgi:outer membrane protein OmpA-like peptidoglycan-associated protein
MNILNTYQVTHYFNFINKSITVLLMLFGVIPLSLAQSTLSNDNIELSTEQFLNIFVDDENNDQQPQSIPENQGYRTRGISLKTNKSKVIPKEDHCTAPSIKNITTACLAKKQSVAVNIIFKAGSSEINNPYLLNNIAKALNSPQLKNCYFVIEGHTDAIGNDYYNLWLSQKRAEQVKHYLKQYRVDEERLIVVGKGEDELLSSFAPSAAENRRVVFKVLNPQ